MRARAIAGGFLWITLMGATPAKAPKGEILGTWRGTSICTHVPGNGSCHDETVVYEIRDVKKSPDQVRLDAFKVVAGQIEPMGELYFRYDRARKRWTSEFRGPNAHILWAFTVQDSEMTGTCARLPSGEIERNAVVRRAVEGQK